MNEKLLHFIWQHQYINKSPLYSDRGEKIEIIYPGIYNTNQGPDFLEAKIKIDNTLLVGSVELHIQASDWHLHKHHLDENYKNVVLHVVWENNKPPSLQQGFATLCLEPYVSAILLEQYASLMATAKHIACQEHLPLLSKLAWQNWKERLAVERLERKTKDIISLLKKNRYHWEEVFWQLIAQNFGLKINAHYFLTLAQKLPITILAKHKNQLIQLEALLLGLSNLIPVSSNDKYVQLLHREYHFLKRKYQLENMPNAPLFLRMRPSNFPTIRLAQLAALIHQSYHLFDFIKETNSVQDIQNKCAVTANLYWDYHYQLNDVASEKATPKKLGSTMLQNIMINTVIPILFTYGNYTQQGQYKDKALQWLEALPSEKNHVISFWDTAGIACNNALESQALLELKNYYCQEKKCLQCAIGKHLLKQDS